MAGLDTEARGKILSPLPGIELRLSGTMVNNTARCLCRELTTKRIAIVLPAVICTIILFIFEVLLSAVVLVNQNRKEQIECGRNNKKPSEIGNYTQDIMSEPFRDVHWS
jgi:hypothetical protein